MEEGTLLLVQDIGDLGGVILVIVEEKWKVQRPKYNAHLDMFTEIS